MLAAVEVKREIRDSPSPQDMSPDPNHNLQSVELTMKLVKDEPESDEDDDGDSGKTACVEDSADTPDTGQSALLICYIFIWLLLGLGWNILFPTNL